MEWINNLSLTKLFTNKEVVLRNEKKEEIKMIVPTIKEKFNNENLIVFYGILSEGKKKFQEIFKVLNISIENNLDVINALCFKTVSFVEFQRFRQDILKSFEFLFKTVKINDKREILIQGHLLDINLWEEIEYILLTCDGESVTKMPANITPEYREFLQQQKENEEKIKKVKGASNNSGSPDGILKIFLIIVYIFPSFNFEQLFDMTLSQIIWLQRLSSKAINYGVESIAYANGNLKKLNFFIK